MALHTLQVYYSQWAFLIVAMSISNCRRGRVSATNQEARIVKANWCSKADICGCLELIPPQFIFGILVTAFDRIALGFSPGHRFQRDICRRITQHIGDLNGILADQKPFLPNLRAVDVHTRQRANLASK